MKMTVCRSMINFKLIHVLIWDSLGARGEGVVIHTNVENEGIKICIFRQLRIINIDLHNYEAFFPIVMHACTVISF